MKVCHASFANPLLATLLPWGVCITVSNPNSTQPPSRNCIISCKNKKKILFTIICYSDMSTQVNNICKSTYLAIRNIGKIRNYLDQPTAEKLVHAFVTSKLDFSNSLLYELSKKQLDKLQRILNAAARITRTKKFYHISPVLRNLHWLPYQRDCS